VKSIFDFISIYDLHSARFAAHAQWKPSHPPRARRRCRPAVTPAWWGPRRHLRREARDEGDACPASGRLPPRDLRGGAFFATRLGVRFSYKAAATCGPYQARTRLAKSLGFSMHKPPQRRKHTLSLCLSVCLSLCLCLSVSLSLSLSLSHTHTHVLPICSCVRL
jgi:hypothetical protein